MAGPERPSTMSGAAPPDSQDHGQHAIAARAPGLASSSDPAVAAVAAAREGIIPAPPSTPRAHAPTHASAPSSSSSSSSSTILPPPEPSYADAIRTLRPADLTTVHQKPCARESLLTGIGAGFGVGGVRFIVGGNVPFQARQYRAMSWAVGAFVLTSAGAHAFCQRRRTLEKRAMARANAIMEEKRRIKRDEALKEQERRKLDKATIEKEGGGGLWKWVGWK